MSRDGFIAGPNDNRKQPLGEGGEQLHDWMMLREASKCIKVPSQKPCPREGTASLFNI